jgi:heme/copper-type cytochrome/quinol oxidase subunit 2
VEIEVEFTMSIRLSLVNVVGAIILLFIALVLLYPDVTGPSGLTNISISHTGIPILIVSVMFFIMAYIAERRDYRV